MLDEEEYRSFLLKRLLITMKICWKNSWKMKTLLQKKKSTALRAAVMDIIIIL
jgi:hypothetical protein